MDRKKASAYIRVTTDDRNAIDEQRRNIENEMFENGYVMSGSYIDTGSGKSLEREGIRQLVHDAFNNNVETVFISNTDKLSTDRNNTTELLEMLSTLNIRVYSVDERRFINGPLDTLSNLSRKLYNTLSEMDENGENLKRNIIPDDKVSVNDPTSKLQNRIIEAYIEMQNERV